MLSVQTNKYHLMVQRAQNQAQHELDTSFKRLSSGSRINSAADDAAGLQITDRLSKAITARGYYWPAVGASFYCLYSRWL